MKKVFMKISQNSQESTCARVSFLTNLRAQALLESYPTTGFYLTLQKAIRYNVNMVPVKIRLDLVYSS